MGEKPGITWCSVIAVTLQSFVKQWSFRIAPFIFPTNDFDFDCVILFTLSDVTSSIQTNAAEKAMMGRGRRLGNIAVWSILRLISWAACDRCAFGEFLFFECWSVNAPTNVVLREGARLRVRWQLRRDGVAECRIAVGGHVDAKRSSARHNSPGNLVSRRAPQIWVFEMNLAKVRHHLYPFEVAGLLSYWIVASVRFVTSGELAKIAVKWQWNWLDRLFDETVNAIVGRRSCFWTWFERFYCLGAYNQTVEIIKQTFVN